MNPSTTHDAFRSPTSCSPRHRGTRTHIDTGTALYQQARDRAQQRHIHRLTHQLLTIYRIPAQDAALVPWLTDRPRANNAQALADWVRLQVTREDSSVDDLSATSQVIQLADRLQRVLFVIEDGQR